MFRKTIILILIIMFCMGISAYATTKGKVIDVLVPGVLSLTGSVVSGGLVYTYAAGTTTPKAIYSDLAMTTALPNPATLDTNGRLVAYGNGMYKIVVKDTYGSTVFTADNVEVDSIANASGGGSVDTATITSAIENNSNSITALQSDVSANSASITLNISSISDNASAIDANAASISLNIASITALEAASSPEWTASGSTQIYITKSVGIGTSTPDADYKLDVVGDSKFNGTAIFNKSSDTTTNTAIWLDGSSDTGMFANSYGQIAIRQAGANIMVLYNGAVNCYTGMSFPSSGFVRVPAGSIGAPSFSFNYDNNTGFYNPSADNIVVTTGGVEAARFTDNQNLLLGSTVDDGINKLQVTGDSKFNGNIYGENTFELYAGGALKLQMIGTFNTYCKGNWVFNSTPQFTDGFKMYTDDDTSVGHPLANTINFTTGGVEAARFTASHTLNLSNTPVYADNAAALAGGLVAGDVYRTSTGVLMITY